MYTRVSIENFEQVHKRNKYVGIQLRYGSRTLTRQRFALLNVAAFLFCLPCLFILRIQAVPKELDQGLVAT
jgi:hypothetical protein